MCFLCEKQLHHHTFNTIDKLCHFASNVMIYCKFFPINLSDTFVVNNLTPSLLYVIMVAALVVFMWWWLGWWRWWWQQHRCDKIIIHRLDIWIYLLYRGNDMLNAYAILYVKNIIVHVIYSHGVLYLFFFIMRVFPW